MSALLAAGPPRRTPVLAALLAVTGTYLVHAHLYSPAVAATGAVRARVASIDEWRMRADAFLAHADSAAAAAARYRSRAAGLEALLARDEEVAALLDAIAREAARTGVEVSMLRPEATLSAAEPDTAPPRHVERSYQVAVRGGYHPIAAFITAVASLDRIVAPADLALAPDPLSAPGEGDFASPSTSFAPGARPALVPPPAPTPPRARLAAEFRILTLLAGNPARPPDAAVPQGVARHETGATGAAGEAIVREHFAYPSHARRDPFLPVFGESAPAVAAVTDAIVLAGILFHDRADLRVAVLQHPRAPDGADPMPAAPGHAVPQPNHHRVGATVGSERIAEIREDHIVLVSIDEAAPARRVLFLPGAAPPRRSDPPHGDGSTQGRAR